MAAAAARAGRNCTARARRRPRPRSPQAPRSHWQRAKAPERLARAVAAACSRHRDAPTAASQRPRRAAPAHAARSCSRAALLLAAHGIGQEPQASRARTAAATWQPPAAAAALPAPPAPPAPAPPADAASQATILLSQTAKRAVARIWLPADEAALAAARWAASSSILLGLLGHPPHRGQLLLT